MTYLLGLAKPLTVDISTETVCSKGQKWKDGNSMIRVYVNTFWKGVVCAALWDRVR